MNDEEKEKLRDKLTTSPDNIPIARVFEVDVNEDGSEVEKPWGKMEIVDAAHANNILRKKGNENKKIRFRCALRDAEKKNKVCNAELYLYTENGKMCFKTEAGSFHQHTFTNKIHDVLDTVIDNPKTFLEKRLLATTRENKKEPVKIYNDIIDVPIASPEKVQPKNLKDFYLQTRKKNMLDHFPNPDGHYQYRYCDGLLNSETIENFRSGLYQFGIPILVIGENPEEDEICQYLLSHNPETGKVTIVLRDPFPVDDGKEHLYFVLFSDVNPCYVGKKYLVLCDWEDSLSSEYRIPIKGKKPSTVRVVKGYISKASSQIQNLDDGLFERMEKVDYFKPHLPESF